MPRSYFVPIYPRATLFWGLFLPKGAGSRMFMSRSWMSAVVSGGICSIWIFQRESILMSLPLTVFADELGHLFEN